MQTTIVLPPAFRLLFKKSIMDSKYYQAKDKYEPNVVYVIEQFFKNDLSKLNPALADKTKPFGIDTIKRAFGKKKPHGIGLLNAQALCVLIAKRNISLENFLNEHGISEPLHSSIENSEIFKESDSLMKAYSKSPKTLSEEEKNAGLAQKIKAYYLKGSFTNISSDPFQNKGQIHDSYVDISYIDKNDLSHSNDYHVIEREGLNYRRDSKLRSEIFTDYFSVRVVTQDLVLKDDHVVLIGNPGVGKTTYAKWLCNKWALGEINTKRIPIYISCRDITQSLSNPISELIKRNFHATEAELDYLIEFIEDKYLMVLDGYDEASPEQKNILEDSLRNITASGNLPPFVLLSRPYALIGSMFRKIPTLYELIGFNSESRSKYITNFFQSNGLGKLKSKQFIALINGSDLLKDLSHNPLHLSYLTSIFSEKDGSKKLKSIESTYDLNKEALNHIVSYHTEMKKISLAAYITKLKKSMPLVADMEINLVFVYHQKGFLDKNYPKAAALSKLGLGRLDQKQYSQNWSFYMLNIHFQETLATEYFGPKITKDALIYLLKNPLYWQLSKLLIGYLVATGRKDLLMIVFDDLRQDMGKALTHKSRLYIILLGEMPSKLMNEIIKDGDINCLVEFYRWLYNDAVWNKLYFESLKKIYFKLTKELRYSFDELVIILIGSLIVVPKFKNKMLTSDQIASVKFPHFLLPIIEHLGIYENPEFLSCIMSKYLALEKLSQDYYLYIEDVVKSKKRVQIQHHWGEEEVDNTRYYILTLLDKVESANLLQPYEKELWEVFATSSLHAKIIARIVSKIVPAEKFISGFEKLARHKNMVDLATLSLMCVAMTASSSYFKHKKKIDSHLSMMKLMLENSLKGKIDMKSHIIARNNYALALAQTDDIELFDNLVWSNYYQQEGFHVMSDLSIKEYDHILQSFFDKALSSVPQIGIIYEFNCTVMSLDTGTLIIGKYYKEFFMLFNAFIQQFSGKLIKLAERKGHFDLREDPLTAELYSLPDALHYPFRIKQFVNDLFDSQLYSNLYIRKRYLPFLLSCEISIYEEKYWHFIIHEIISEDSDLGLAVHLLRHNKIIYLYESNLSYLIQCWEKLALLLADTDNLNFISSALSDIIAIAYNAMKFAFELKGANSAGLSIPISVLLKSLDQKIPILENIDSFYYEDNIPGLAIFPLLASLTHDPFFVLDNEFDLLMEQVDDSRAGILVAEMAELCRFEPSMFRECIGEKLYERLRVYCLISQREDQPVSIADFKQMLNT